MNNEGLVPSIAQRMFINMGLDFVFYIQGLTPIPPSLSLFPIFNIILWEYLMNKVESLKRQIDALPPAMLSKVDKFVKS